jgi:putative membrane protein
MVLPAVVSALHVLTLGLGLGAIFVRGARLRDLRRAPADTATLKGLFAADGAWGLAAMSWIVTGLVRAFAGIEKASTFYTHNGFFLIKMTLFLGVFLLELRPMVTFIRWRRARAAGQTPWATSDNNLTSLIRLNDAEVALTVLIPFAAALMARGVWLF